MVYVVDANAIVDLENNIMKTFYALVWLAILGSLFIALLMLTSCAGDGYYDEASVSYDSNAACYLPQPTYFIPYQPTIQPLNIDTAFHPAPLIPRP